LDLGALRLAPAAADGRLGVRLGTRRTGSLSIRRLRLGGTSLDLEARWRPGATVLRARRAHGPALVLEVEFPEGAAVTADEVPLDGARARLELRDRHEVVAYA
ncbi:MAG TPA: hypothetical protein VFX50_12990, partial [Gemmatimonadales bacterium]|nr:hypothetical protein [Gemmatimonadales bacterium]